MTFAGECAQMVEDIETVMGVSITLASVTPGALNTSTGVRAETVVTQSIPAWREPESSFGVSAGDGRQARAERVYSVREAAITIGTPRIGWRVTDGSWTGEIAGVERRANLASYRLICRAAGGA